MPPEDVALAITKVLNSRKSPRYISTGSNVRLYNLLGYIQCWLWPALVSSLFQDKFGLNALKSKINISRQDKTL